MTDVGFAEALMPSGGPKTPEQAAQSLLRGALYYSAGQSLTDGTEASITLDTMVYDTGGFKRASSTTRFTVPSGLGGYYEIEGAAEFAANVTGARYVLLRLNGATSLALDIEPAASTASVTQRYARCPLVFLNPTDYVELRASQNSGGALATTAGRERTWFSIVRRGL